MGAGQQFKPSVLSVAVMAACTVLASTLAQAADPRPAQTRRQLEYNGQLEIGAAYVSDENFQFGQYNGLDDDSATVIGNVDWSSAENGVFWNFSGTDLGLDTRAGSGRWRNDTWDVLLEIDSQKQVGNDSGSTPYRGGDVLNLPDDWVSANTTGGFSALDASLRNFEPELKRDRYSLDVAAKLNDSWKMEGSVLYEHKDGDQAVGAAIFTNAAAGEAAILPQQIDYDKTEFDFTLNYTSKALLLNGSAFYSDFDNSDDLLQWQNAYSSFGPNVRYPEGYGGISQAPDNEFYRLRLLGTYFFSPGLRLQVDGSFGHTEQDQNFADYTVNPNLDVTLPPPRNSLDGETDTKVLDARIFWRPTSWKPLQKLSLQGFYHGEERDFDIPRDGYQYVLGDATNQVDAARQLYSRANDYSVNRAGIEGSYPLPLRSKLWLTYEYEEVERDNTAVKKTEEDRYKLRYRIPLPGNIHMRVEGLYADRAADNYDWSQSYYATRDTALINATPDNQRYENHPQLSQYHLATREQSEMKLDFDWQPGMAWNVTLNLMYRENDYDKTDLGLSDTELNRGGLTVSWAPRESLTMSAYGSYGEFETQQRGRSFRGGVEKNAFEVNPPLPQASDPSRDWDVDVKDEVTTVGFNAAWQFRDDLALSADYSYVDTTSDYKFADGGGTGLSSEPLPADSDSDQHHLILEGVWDYREDISVKVNYQYWKYDSEDWAVNGLSQNSIDKVLTLGEQEADEDLHYIGTSIIYRWQ
jgi:MtrB/PioB family decaheme-associated outer membrane protein